MTAKQSSVRLAIYTAIAFFTPLAGNWEQMQTANLYQWSGLICQGILAALITARAYIDTTPSQVEK